MTNQEIIAHLCKRVAKKARHVSNKYDVNVDEAAEDILEEIVEMAAQNLEWD